MSMAVWLFKPRSHGRKRRGARARNGAPLPGRHPSFRLPHRSASSALCPCGHAASFRRRASSFDSQKGSANHRGDPRPFCITEGPTPPSTPPGGGGGRGRGGIRSAMEGGGGGGAAAAAAAPSTAPARGASRAALLDQRKKEVQDAAVVGALVKVVYAEAWTTRAGEAMSSGYGKQVLKKKLCHIWGGDQPDGFEPSACQTYRS